MAAVFLAAFAAVIVGCKPVETRIDPAAAKLFNGAVYSEEPGTPRPQNTELSWKTLVNPSSETSYYVEEARKGDDAYLLLTEKTGETQNIYLTLAVHDAIKLPRLDAAQMVADSGCREIGSAAEPDRSKFGVVFRGDLVEGDNWRPAEGSAWRVDLVTKRFLVQNPLGLECNYEEYGD